jgi:hypothetical protein
MTFCAIEREPSGEEEERGASAAARILRVMSLEEG